MSDPHSVPQKPTFEETDTYLTLVKEHNESVAKFLAHWEKWSACAKTDDEREQDKLAKEVTLYGKQQLLNQYIAMARRIYEDYYPNG